MGIDWMFSTKSKYIKSGAPKYPLSLLQAAPGFYALVEISATTAADLGAGAFESCMEQGWVVDGGSVKAKLRPPILWRLRGISKPPSPVDAL